MEVVRQSSKALNRAVDVLRKGGVVICPTDTVYGFLADASNKKAVEKIFTIKKRPKVKPLPVFVKDLKMAKTLAEIDERQEKILRKYWPGKYTFILNLKIKNQTFVPSSGRENAKLQGKNQKLSKLVIAKDNTIGIRIPKYRFLNDLLNKINKPLAQTSVNLSDEPPMRNIQNIIKHFSNGKQIALIINGENLKKSKPSKIIDSTTMGLTVLR